MSLSDESLGQINTSLRRVEGLLDDLIHSRAFNQLNRIHEQSADGIDLGEIWHLLWKHKLWIIAAALAFSAAAVLYSMSLPNTYKAKALLAPSSQEKKTSLSGIVGQLGSLGSLAGLDVGGGGDKQAAAIEILKSQRFISLFVNAHDITPELMAAKKWDPLSNELHFNPSIYDPAKKAWLRAVNPPRQAKPSEAEIYRAFHKILSISQDKETKFITVSIEHISPTLAKQWTDWLVQDLNEFIRRKDVEEAFRSIEFLQKQLEKTSIADMRSIFYQLIEEQTKIVMLAEVRDEYIFSILDPPVVPEAKSSPNRLLYLILGAMFGIVSSTFVLLVVFIRQKKISQV